MTAIVITEAREYFIEQSLFNKLRQLSIEVLTEMKTDYEHKLEKEFDEDVLIQLEYIEEAIVDNAEV